MDAQIAKFESRTRAIIQLSKGISQKSVAQIFGKDIRTIRRWWAKHNRNESLLHRKGAGPPKKLNRISKIVIAKSLEKRHNSTSKLAMKLNNG